MTIIISDAGHRSAVHQHALQPAPAAVGLDGLVDVAMTVHASIRLISRSGRKLASISLPPSVGCSHSRIKYADAVTAREPRKNEKENRSDIMPNPGGHNAPMHRGGHVQNRIRRRQARRAKSEPICRRSNHERLEDQAGMRKRANTGTVGGWRVHPQTTHQAGTLRLDPNTATSCAKGIHGPVQR